jgi:uncharacterized membrane protein
LTVKEDPDREASVSGQLETAKRPVSPTLAGPYGHPFHPILVTIPIGAWLSSLTFDIASHIVGKPGFLTQGSEWLIAIGVLGALAAAAIGALDLLTIPAHTTAFRTGLAHMSLNLAITVAYALNFLWRRGSYTDGAPVGGGQLTLSIISFAALGLSGFLGGRLAFRYGVRVVTEATQADGFITRSTKTEE